MGGNVDGGKRESFSLKVGWCDVVCCFGVLT